MSDMEYSVVLPVYNEEDNIAPLHAELTPVMHSLGKPYLFLNLRAAAANPENPLHKPQVMSMTAISSKPYTISNITKAFDGIFYVERMAPTTPIRSGDYAIPY